MNVKILTHTPEPERIIACAGKLCYSNKVNIDSLWDSITPEETDKFISKLISSHHFSPLEHVSFTFAIEGVSRSLMGQITRHRLASFSIRSQRYCNETHFEYTLPRAIEYNEEAYGIVEDTIKIIEDAYDNLVALGVKKENARAILPNACCTRMIVTMNARELLHFFSLRCCVHAQDEIRELAYDMLRLCKEVAPTLFANAGAACKQLGYCPEGTGGCGAYSTLDELKANADTFTHI